MFFSKSVTVSYKIRKRSEEKYNRKRKEERKKIFLNIKRIKINM